VIDGKPYKTFLDQQSKIMKTWILSVDGEMCRVVLEKDTLDIWVNGKKVEVAAEFTDDGMIIFSNTVNPRLEGDLVLFHIQNYVDFY